MEFLRDLWGYMWARKTMWLMPVIIVLLLLVSIIVLTSGSALLSIFYTIF